MARVWQAKQTWLSPVLRPVERLLYDVSGVDSEKGQDWLAYTLYMLAFSAAGFLALYVILRIQQVLPLNTQNLDPLVLGALFICLIPTTIGGLLSAVGIAGMDRLLKVNVLATSARAVKAAGDVDTLLLDRTGTIACGDRQAVEVIGRPGLPPSPLCALH